MPCSRPAYCDFSLIGIVNATHLKQHTKVCLQGLVFCTICKYLIPRKQNFCYQQNKTRNIPDERMAQSFLAL